MHLHQMALVFKLPAHHFHLPKHKVFKRRHNRVISSNGEHVGPSIMFIGAGEAVLIIIPCLACSKCNIKTNPTTSFMDLHMLSFSYNSTGVKNYAKTAAACSILWGLKEIRRAFNEDYVCLGWSR